MKQILIVMGRYLPGFHDGGPVRSTANLIEQLGDEYDIRVLCYDRDHGDAAQYPGIRLYDWNRVGKGLVYYVPEGGITRGVLLKLAAQADLLYLWGCFNRYTIGALQLNRAGRIEIPVVVAAMGLFSPNEFRRKYAKKKLVTEVLNRTGLFREVYWSVSSEREARELRAQVRTADDRILIARDLPCPADGRPVPKPKEPGRLKVVWLSRIAWKKNLTGAIRILRGVKAEVRFTIYGPIDYAPDCWEACRAELAQLPPNIRWEYGGEVPPDQVIETLRAHHVFLFPTLGENYGHVIPEALAAGCPCILSDQTPWQDLEAAGAGFAFPLDHPGAYVQALEAYAAMDAEAFGAAADRAVQYAARNSRDQAANTGYRRIFAL